MKYGVVIEENDWEGETWRFYFPVRHAGDLFLFGRLRDHLAADDYTQNITVALLVEESEVDVLVKHDPNEGYMAGHHKFDDPLNVNALLALSGEELAGALYKGGVRKFAGRAE